VWRGVLWGLLALTALFLSLLGRPYSQETLCRNGAARMATYKGTRHCLGGGGLIEAELKQGLLTANPRLLRLAIYLWWHDCSARQLGEGYLSFTRLLITIPSINQTDPSRFSPADLAVTEDGSHVMAYLGDSRWIEAHPEPGKVIVVKVPSSDNPRFQIPVRILRWKQLDPDR